ncbi:unnamed protein product [Prunus armeniaca]
MMIVEIQNSHLDSLQEFPTPYTIWHYHGGCQVERVVDKGYGVLGIDSLRVIDGSTFYHTPGANPQATVMMLGRQVHGAKDSA